MISKYKHKELHWVDLEQPTNEEIVYILEEYSIPSFIKEKITLETIEDEISLDYDFIFASFNFSQVLLGKKIDNRIIFVANDDFIITIHSEPLKALGEFLKELELDVMLKEKLKISDNRLLFAHLLKSLYVNSQKELINNRTEIIGLKRQNFLRSKKLRLLTLLTIASLTAIILLSIYVIIRI